jgi:iron complex outermembrane receptor protein
LYHRYCFDSKSSSDSLFPQAQNSKHNAVASSVKETELPEVVVADKKGAKPAPKEGSAESGYRNKILSVGPLGNAAVLDTPYSINATSGELIEYREAHTVFDALTTNPSVSNLMVPNGYSSLSRVMVRGFTAADAGDLRDGLVDRSFTFVPLENVERIEVLNGLSSFLNGFSAIGGTINYISKQPADHLLAKLAYGTYGGGIRYLHADLGGPIPFTNHKLTTRLNAYREDGDTYIHDGSQWRTFLSGSAAYKLRPGTVLKADSYYQDYAVHSLQTYINAASGNWTTNNINVPSASVFDPRQQYGQSYTYNRSRKTIVGLGLDSRLNKIFSLRSAYCYGKMWRNYSYVDATLTDNAGNYTEVYTTTPRQNETTHTDYVLIDASFNTRAVHHDLTFGMTNYYYHYTRGTDVPATLGASTITSPVVYPFPKLTIGPMNTLQDQPARNILLGDRIHIDTHFSALAGLTYAGLKQEAWGTSNSISTAHYSQHAFTPSAGVIYKPIDIVSTYFSYMQGLSSGGTAPSTAVNANQILGPSVNKQYEIGAKAELPRAQLTAALFRINAVNEYTDPRDNVYKKDGIEVHQGFEFSGTGRVTDRLTAVGGLMLMRARIEQARNNTAIQGKIPLNVPEQQARAYLEYRIPGISQLTPSFGVNYSGRRPVDSTNAHFFDGATVFDAGLRYQPTIYGHRSTLNLYVSNIGNTRYWTYYRSGDGLLIGEPRVVSFSLKTEW